MYKNKIVSSLLWTFGERVLAQLVTVIIGIILARILAPEVYGVISIIMIFISFCNIFVTSGFGIALVQKKYVDEKDYQTSFWLSFIFSFILYLIMFILAPYIGKIYNNKSIALILRVMLLKVPLSSFSTIQQAYIQRKMQFKLFFISTSIGTISSGILGVCLAYMNFGVWALVIQYLSNSILDILVLLIIGEWRPKLMFCSKKGKEIFHFGWKILLSELISNLDNNIKGLFIGKVFGPMQLAYFDQGKKYSSLLVSNINVAITKVLLPVYASIQEEKKILKELLRKSIRISSYILVPILVGFALVSEEFIKIFLTDKWLPSVIYIQIFCIAYLTRPIENICMQVILAIGRSDIRLIILVVINLISLILTILVIFMSAKVIYIAIISLVCSIVSTACFLYYTNKLFTYSLREQISDFSLLFISVFIMSLPIIALKKTNINIYLKFGLEISIGVFTYIIITRLFKLEGYTYLIKKIRKKE